ncbi:FtsW/RodA/SpoVE family cell cycle protein [Selenomonas bovis]|uniref:FtsW/RodA/SpoVE family cell cycle protein n=1 Tax=Selenomonas bovis TaxID=416586 RepID=UPI001FD40B7C|nr:putative peptidoglycan glycosyltransferase FtsW [Selenomonas bovis]MCI7056062.1 putative lipid II flippase FtsW [Selenomonas bovis]
MEKGEAAAAPRSPLVRKKFWSSDMEAVFGITLVLLVLGTVNVFSSSFVSAELRFDDAYFFLKRHLISMSLGLVLFFIGARADYHIWRKLMPWVLALTVLALVAVFFIGPEVNGARRWLPLPFMQVQPAEGAKLVAIMLASASMAARVRHKARVSPFNLQYACILVMAALVEKEPDMGTACVIIGVPIILYLVAAQLPLRRLLAVLAALAAGAAFFIMSQTYRIERVRIMWDPWQDAQNAGYQIVQSLSTIGSGEFLGMGLGVGVSKYDYLPEAHTDFAFAIFCQENGYLGALFVFLLYTALAVYGARIADKASDRYGQLLAFGIVVLVVGQAICNMLMVGGVFPVVGVPLPFISYGGSSLIFTLLSVGILVSIGRIGEVARRDRARAREEAEARENAPRPHIGLRVVRGQETSSGGKS